MVKQSGFLNKIVKRFRTGSVKVEREQNGGRSTRPSTSGQPGKTAGNPLSSRSAPVTKVSSPIPEEIVPSSRKKLSTAENAELTMNKSFRELSSLLRGVNTRMEDQGGRLETMDANLARLPAAAEAQLDVLKTLVANLEKQSAMNGKMVETFAELPTVMKGVQESLSRSAATDERTAETLDDFKGTMARIQGSMGQMVESAKAQATAAETLAGDHQETARSLEQSTKDGLAAIRGVQEDQANRITKIVGETGKWNRLIVVLLVLTFAALVSILFALMR